MKIRTLSLLLSLVIVTSLLPITAQAGDLDNGLQYKAYTDYVEITGYTGTTTEVVIPAQIDGLPTTSIGYEAFRDCENLTSISIPDCITKIGAFAFYDCKRLSAISIPDSVIEIGNFSFSGCKMLTSITIPNGVTEIGSGVFSNCENLTSISIPDGITEIGNNAFLKCEKLTSISIPNSVNKIGDYTFAGCESLTSISIPADVTRIGNWTFSGCKKLTIISIPDNVSEIGEYAFSDCESLISILTLHCVTEIGNSAFRDCKNLTSISIQGDITEIDHSTFYGCKNLTSITIPDSLKEIGNRAFQGCENLSNISIPDSVTKIGDSAFWGCEKLTYISVPAGVTEIGESVFSSCKGLTSITVPYGITEIKYHAFWDCVNLDTIYFTGDSPVFGEEVFWWVIATAYYPFENPTWTDDVMKNYGGRITWVPYNPNHTHEYKAVVASATCTTQGHTTYTCSCGDTYEADYVDALGHDYADGFCTRCGEADPDYVKPMENPFTDMEEGRFYYEPVLWAVDNGITYGLTDTEFGTEASCKRSQVVTFLWRAAGSPAPNSTAHSFVDVKKGSFYEKAVLWAVENGITIGIDSTHFDPDAPCTRSEVVTFLWRAADKPAASGSIPFSDVPANKWYAQPVLWAVQNGITYGMTDTLFDTEGICTRAQVVTFLYRAYT